MKVDEVEHTQAYILVTVELGRAWEVAEEALKLDGVKMAHAVTGPFDVVVFVEFTKLEVLGALIEKLHGIKGVQRTQTAIAMPERL
jgi:DNA-binding Lrp family transcriptional regulator